MKNIVIQASLSIIIITVNSRRVQATLENVHFSQYHVCSWVCGCVWVYVCSPPNRINFKLNLNFRISRETIPPRMELKNETYFGKHIIKQSNASSLAACIGPQSRPNRCASRAEAALFALVFSKIFTYFFNAFSISLHDIKLSLCRWSVSFLTSKLNYFPSSRYSFSFSASSTSLSADSSLITRLLTPSLVTSLLRRENNLVGGAALPFLGRLWAGRRHRAPAHGELSLVCLGRRGRLSLGRRPLSSVREKLFISYYSTDYPVVAFAS